jgi:uncharacterized cupin superfamily protein
MGAMATFAGDSGPRVISALHLALAWEPVASAQSVAGEPRTGSAEVVSAPGIEVGVWSHTPGVSTDTEADEVFVVLSGRARIEFADGAVLDVGPGDIGILPRGAQTTWTVHEELRKVYVIRSNA